MTFLRYEQARAAPRFCYLEIPNMSPQSAADDGRFEPALGMDEQLRAFDDAHFLCALGCGALQHGEDGGCRVRQRLRRIRSTDTRGDEQRGEEVAGPFGLIGSFGVRTRQACDRSTASVSISPFGVPASSAEVTTTVDGPCAISARAASII